MVTKVYRPENGPLQIHFCHVSSLVLQPFLRVSTGMEETSMLLGRYLSGYSCCWMGLRMPTHGTISGEANQPVVNPESLTLGASSPEEGSDVTLCVCHYWCYVRTIDYYAIF